MIPSPRSQRILPVFPVFGRQAAIRVQVLIVVVGFAMCGSSRTLANENRPDALIDRLSQHVLSTIKSNPQMQGSDPAPTIDLVDRVVMPHVDFDRTTALAVGRGWRRATPTQRAALIREFRRLLVRTYAGAIRQVQYLSIRIQPLRASSSDDTVIVRSEIIGRGEPIALNYRLHMKDGRWLIFDLGVLGVWMVQTYRNQFKTIIARQGIDGLVQTLRRKNKQPALTE